VFLLASDAAGADPEGDRHTWNNDGTEQGHRRLERKRFDEDEINQGHNGQIHIALDPKKLLQWPEQ